MVFGVGGADTEERAPNKNDAPLTVVKTTLDKRVKQDIHYLLSFH